MNVELSMDRPPRNLDLILLLHVGFVDGSTAIGAGVGQRGLVGLVDLVRLGCRPMGLGALAVAGFAARLLRLRLAAPVGALDNYSSSTKM